MEKRKIYLTFSKTLCIILTLIMLLTAVPLTVIGSAGTKSYAVGDTIEYGSYPQTEVTDTSVTAQLDALAGSTDTWTSYKYMEALNTPGDYMKYKDVEYNGEKYRGVYFSLYRPDFTTDTASTSVDTYQDYNGYTCGYTYWFKYEPIEWVILEAGTGGLAVSKNILDSQAYCDTFYYKSDDEYYGDSSYSYYSNNWEHSTIRTWLNSTFVNTAFTTSQQSNIVETTISTPAFSTSEYDSADTSDKVFLLSYDDVQNTAYGFVSGTDESTTRQKTGTDYAKSQGLYEFVDYYRFCCHSEWRLRSASYVDTYVVYEDGYVSSLDTYITRAGVVAALYFQSYNPCTTHNYKAVVTAPTCTKKGYTTHTCTKCGVHYADTYIAALGHKWNSGKVTKAATCKATGVKTYTCTVCKATKTETIKKSTTHTYKNVVTAATLTKAGKIQSKCSVCGKVAKTTAIAKIASVKLSKTAYTYTGKAIRPTVTVKDSNGKTIASSNYSISYSNNVNPGSSAKVKVTFKGNYSGTKTLKFSINLAQVKITSSSMSSSYKVSLKWNKVPGATKYEIYYYNTSSKSYKALGTTTKTSLTQTWKGWSQVKFKVRAVYTQGSKVVAYGPWSSVVTVKRK